MSKETEEKRNNKKLINAFILFICLIFGVIFYARFVGVKGLFVREYRILNEKIPANFSGVKIVHISDLLYGSTTNLEYVEKMVKKINELKPDIVVFTGGLISDSYKIKNKEIKELSKLFSKIDSNIGKYSVKGNEDAREYEIIMNDSKFETLSNEGMFIYSKGITPIFIGGFADSIKDAINIDSTFEILQNDPNQETYFKIILMHEGDNTTKLLKQREDVDLILAGNSLNGSVIVPLYGGLYLPVGSKKYYDKYYKVGNTEIFVSGGLGTDTLSYRFNNHPSFNFYRLKSL